MRKRADRRASLRSDQSGAALILFATVLVLGVAWYAVGALGRAAITPAEREMKTGAALYAAKQAFLSYVTQYAARTDHAVPGRLPCPESLSPTAGSEGAAASSCSNLTVEFGRLPWRTIGIEQPRDGYGETLWYVLGPGFRSSPINFGSTGQLTVDGVANAAVALIIAPGPALNNLAVSGTPASPCAKQNQSTNRYAKPYSLSNFAECFDTSSLPAKFATTASSTWFNDRVIAITAHDVMDAIAGPIADRMQRQIAPAISEWNTLEPAAKQWGTPYLPFASTFSDPATHTYACGSTGVREGLAPLELSSSCDTRWSGSATLTVLGLNPFGATPCDQQASYLRCRFSVLLPPVFSAQITTTAPDVANSFRSAINSSAIVISDGGSVSSFSLALSDTSGAATLTVNISWPLSIASLVNPVEVRIPYVANGAVLTDSRLDWFKNNNWQRYTYYSVAPSATVNPSAPCSAAGDTGCIEVWGLPTSTGNYWNKRLVLALMGRELSGQCRSCAPNDITQYVEEQNASSGDRIFRASFMVANPSAASPPFPLFNDRTAACPFEQTTTGGTVSICN